MYYRPEISDFYVGYEYEYKTHDGAVHTKEYMDNLPWLKSNAKDWVDITAYINRTLNGRMGNDPGLQDIETIRVKYLDRADIESLGWTHTGGQLTSWGRQDFERKFHLLQFYPSRVDNIGLSMVKIMTKEDPMALGSYKGYDKVLYDGSCKSINELKILMKWLSVE